MDASDDEGARFSADEDDAASISSKGSGKAASSPKGSESGDEVQDHNMNSDQSDDDDEVHVSEAEAASIDGSDSEQEQKRMDISSDVGSPSREEEKGDDKEGSDAGSVLGDDNELTIKDQDGKDESDAGSVSGDEKDEPGSQDENFAEKKEIDRGSVSGDDQNLSDNEPEEGHNERAENEPSSPQRGDESPQEINIDSGDEEGESKLNIDSGGEDKGSDADSENEDSARKSSVESDAEENDARPHSRASDEGKDSDAEAGTNLASDDEGSSPTKSSNLEDTPTKEGEENDQEESDDEVRGKSVKKKRAHGDLVSNIFGHGSSEEDNDKDEENSVPTNRKKKMRKRARVSIESDEENEENDKEEKENAEESDEEMREENENAEAADKDNRSDGEEKVEVEAENEAGEENEVKEASKIDSDDDSADEALRQSKGEDFMSDFDLMLQKKKEESSRRRRRKDVDIINDSDDLIAEIISKMRQAADEDKMLNKEKKTATKKLKILPLVMSQLKKQDLKMAFLDQGVLNVIADWMAPLPDKSLPHLHIREGMIKMLLEYPSIDHSLLKSSGVGRVLMYLYKHPKETKSNKEKAGKLITEWARPIFNVTTDYHSLTKEEREQRDMDHLPKKKKARDEVEEEDESTEKKDIDFNESDGKLRPGDKGWVGRARVPMPSTKDYVNRPQWNVEMELGRSVKKPMNRFEKHMRNMQDKKRNSKGQRAVTISIEGRKMAI